MSWSKRPFTAREVPFLFGSERAMDWSPFSLLHTQSVYMAVIWKGIVRFGAP